MGSDLILNKVIILIIASISVLLFISCSDYANPVLVQRVIDGDTILLETGERVRYLDIDTPETVHPTKPIQCFGPQAYLRNKELVENKYVTLKQSNTNKDQYGRLLRYVYIEDLFINAVLVSEGYAFAKDYNNPGHLYKELKSLELNAIKNKTGLWEQCK